MIRRFLSTSNRHTNRFFSTISNNNNNANKQKQLQSPLSWKSVLIVSVLSASFITYYRLNHEKKIDTKQQIIGKAAIGGPFTLVNEHGKPMTDKDLRGKYLLLYFGFTFCPDICPNELRKMSRVLHRLKDECGIDENVLYPIFISLDPNRDSVEQIRNYIKEFHPNLHGMTGTPLQCEEASKQFRVYSSKAFEEGESEDDYLIDHSIIHYLMDKNGEFLDYYGKSKDENEMFESIKKHLR